MSASSATPLRLDYVVDGEALVRRNLACDADASVRAYVDALRSALREEFESDHAKLVLVVNAGTGEAVHVRGADETTRAQIELRARATADAVKRCVPWPVYE